MKSFVKKGLGTIRFRLRQFRRRITYSDVFICFLASLATCIIILYTKTLRIRYWFHPDFLKLDRTKFCCGFWHGRQFLLIASFGDWHGSIMTDLSWAGDIQTRIVRKFGYVPVRGSSQRKGVQALIKMKKAMEQGCFGAFAMDGPSGPIYKSKPGILFLARKLGYPIVPVATSANRAWVFKNTWCRYLLPKPFSQCYVAVGEPVWGVTVEGKLAPEELDRILVEWTAEADRAVGRMPEGDAA